MLKDSTISKKGWLGYLLAHGWPDLFAGQYDSGILRFYLCCAVSKFVRMCGELAYRKLLMTRILHSKQSYTDH